MLPDSKGSIMAGATLPAVMLLLFSTPGLAENPDGATRGNRSVPEFGGPSSVAAELNEEVSGLTDPRYRFRFIENGLKPWFDFKRKLADEYGYTPGFDYQALFQAAAPSAGEDKAAGGIARAYGAWTLFGRDGKNPGTFFYKVENRHKIGTRVTPQNLGFSTGAVSITGTGFNENLWSLTNLFWQQKLADGRVSINAGHVDATDYVDIYGLANFTTAFQNLSFLTNPTIGAPNQGLGAAAGVSITDNFYAVGGFTDANGDPTEPGFKFFNELETFKHAEIGFTSAPDRIYFDNIHLTVWHQDKREKAGVPEDYGVSGSAAWFFDDAWMPFVRAGWSRGTAALLNRNVSTGIGYLNRWRDLAGIGVSWGRARGINEDQFTGEAFYRFQASPNFALTLDGQVIANPAATDEHDLVGVLGIRARINL